MYNTLNSLGMSDLHLHYFVYIQLGDFRLDKGICSSNISHCGNVCSLKVEEIWHLRKCSYFKRFPPAVRDFLMRGVELKAR